MIYLRYWLMLLLAMPMINSLAQLKNIKLDEGGPSNYGCEPAIAINPKNPLNMVAAAVLDNLYVTQDGGTTWQHIKMRSPYGVYGDPVLVCDAKGTFYYFHLADPSGEGWKNEQSLKHIVCHVSNDGGKTWDEGNSIGYNPPKDQDKPWATCDAKGNVYVTWTQFDNYRSDDPGCKSQILLSSSSNGKKWSKPMVISQNAGDCLDGDNTVAGAMPAIDDKRMYVTWAFQNNIYLDRSFDGGSTWLSMDVPIVEQPGGWDFNVPGHSRSNGLPVLMADKTKTPTRGMLYLVWADQRNGEDNTDIWFARSNNFGDNWTYPLKINSDAERKHQYLPWMTVDNTTGYIYIVFYDRRNYDDEHTDVYLAYSTDSGSSFRNVKISETAFRPDEGTFFGDYTNIAAHKGIITPIWTRMDEGKTSIWTAVIKHEELVKMK